MMKKRFGFVFAPALHQLSSQCFEVEFRLSLMIKVWISVVDLRITKWLNNPIKTNNCTTPPSSNLLNPAWPQFLRKLLKQ